MTSKERMLLAIEGKTPDRLPVTIHQWQDYHLKHYMGGMTDIEANRACGLDASINCFRLLETESPSWRVEAQTTPTRDGHETLYTIHTPEGTLTTREGSNAMTTWVLEPLVKHAEDIEWIRKYQPVPRFDRRHAFETYDALGDSGILRTFLCGKQGGCWQDACELYGVERLILATYDDPDWVHRFLQILLEQKLRYIEENLRGLPFDLVETGGGASSNTVISPAIHREFCLPYDQKLHAALHALGYRVVYHTCGGMTRILDCILENGCDVSETLSPAAIGGDIATDGQARQLHDTLRPKLSLIGGMDQINLLTYGTPDAIAREVERLFQVFGAGGGYICSASDHFFEAPVENLRAFARAAQRCSYSA